MNKTKNIKTTDMKYLKAILRFWIVVFAVMLINSCILKEYDVEKIDLEEHWEFDITTPLFKGKILLKEVIAAMDTFATFPDKPVTEVKFSEDSSLIFATEFLYGPIHFPEDFRFHINDDYDIKEGSFRYKVTNSLPFPVNLQTNFFFITEGPGSSDVIFLPPPFAPAENENGTMKPVTTVHEVNIPVESLDFFRRNRVRFSIWFNQPADPVYAKKMDASLPLEMTIVFSGTVSEKKK